MEVDVDDEFVVALRKRSEEKGFDDLEKYINYVLGQIASKVDVDESSYSETEEEEIKDKLKNLGYDPS